MVDLTKLGELLNWWLDSIELHVRGRTTVMICDQEIKPSLDDRGFGASASLVIQYRDKDGSSADRVPTDEEIFSACPRIEELLATGNWVYKRTSAGSSTVPFDEIWEHPTPGQGDTKPYHWDSIAFEKARENNREKEIKERELTEARDQVSRRLPKDAIDMVLRAISPEAAERFLLAFPEDVIGNRTILNLRQAIAAIRANRTLWEKSDELA